MKLGPMIAVGLLFPLGLTPNARADVPRTIPFQAQVKTAADKPITTPTSFAFSLYAAATGGTTLWTETQMLAPSNGIIVTTLGTVTPLTISFDQPLWVGVAVGADPEMTPRLPLASVPYALSIPDGLVTAAKLASDPASLNKVSGGTMTASGSNIGIGVVTPGFPLSFAPVLGDKIALWGNSGGHYGLGVQSGVLQVHADIAASDVAFGFGSSGAFTERMRVKGSGNVGIGTSTPASKLTVAGVIQSTTGGVKFPDNTVQLTATPASLPPSGAAGGDLNGTYPNPTIGALKVVTDRIADAAVTDAKIAGMAYAKLTGAPTIPTTLPPSGVAGGDLTGSYPNPSIGALAVTDAKIAGMAYSKLTGAPTALPPSGAAGGDLAGTYPNPTIGALKVTDAKIAGMAYAKLTGAPTIPTTLPPSGVAGGDLTGSYPNPSIGALAVTDAKIAGMAYSKLIGAPTALPPSGAAGGDLTGTYPNPTIGALKVTDDKIAGMAYSKLTGAPTSLPPSGAAGGDLTGAYPNPTIGALKVTDAKIAGMAYSKLIGAPTIPTTLPPSGAAGGDLVGTYPNPTLGTDVVDFPNLVLNALSLYKTSGGVMTSANGNVGIGTTGPSARLEVAGSTTTNAVEITRPVLVADQVSDGGVSGNKLGTPGDTMWQGFLPATSPASYQLVAVKLYIGLSGQIGDDTWLATLRIYEGTISTGRIVYEQRIGGDSNPALKLFMLSTPVTLSYPNKYTIAILPLQNIRWTGSGSNPYPEAMSDVSSSWDYYFQTITTNGLTDPSVVVRPGTGYVGFGLSDPEHRIQLPNTSDSSGEGQAHGWITYSSERWKTNVHPIGDALSKVEKLRGVYYDWKPAQGGKHDIGFIAEDVGKVLPEVVSWEADGVRASGMDYARVNALLVEAIKQQQKQIEDLRKDIAVREKRDAEKEARLTRLEKLISGRGAPTQ